jgi:anti-anti-sigma regulatory factor
LQLSDAQAREAISFVPAWLDRVRNSGARRVVIDLSAVQRVDWSGFGVLLAKLRDVLRVAVQITGVGVSDAVSLRSIGLLDGVNVQQRRQRPEAHGSTEEKQSSSGQLGYGK